MSFFWQGRLGEKPSDLLKHYYAETMREPLFLEALHQWDKAQVVVLGEQKRKGVRPCLLPRPYHFRTIRLTRETDNPSAFATAVMLWPALTASHTPALRLLFRCR